MCADALMKWKLSMIYKYEGTRTITLVERGICDREPIKYLLVSSKYRVAPPPPPPRDHHNWKSARIVIDNCGGDLMGIKDGE